MKNALILLLLLAIYLMLSFVQFDLNILSWSWSAQLILGLSSLSGLIIKKEIS